MLCHETWLYFENGQKHFRALQEFLNAKFASYFWKFGNFLQVSGVVEEIPYEALLINYLVKYIYVWKIEIYVWKIEIKCSVKAAVWFQSSMTTFKILFSISISFMRSWKGQVICAPPRTLFIFLFTFSHWPKYYLAYTYQHNYEGKTGRLCKFSCALLVKLKPFLEFCVPSWE